MTAMTFESSFVSPRRAALRRQHRPAPRVAVVPQELFAARNAGATGSRSTSRAGLFALTAVTIGVHAWVALSLSGEAPPRQLAQKREITIAIAPPPPVVIPPPPPPPPVQARQRPAPSPRIAPAPPLPVDAAPTSAVATADTVQVAAAPSPPVPVQEAPPAPPAPPVEKITEPRGYAGYLRNPAPEYPLAAQERGLQGRVILKVNVLASGKPADVQVAKTSGHRVLDDAAIKAVLAWTFDPARRGSTPIDGWVQVPLTFAL